MQAASSAAPSPSVGKLVQGNAKLENTQDSGYNSFQSSFVLPDLSTEQQQHHNTDRQREIRELQIRLSSGKEFLHLTSKALADHDAAMTRQSEALKSCHSVAENINMDQSTSFIPESKPRVERTKEYGQTGPSEAIDTIQSRTDQSRQRQAPAYMAGDSTLLDNRKPSLSPVAVEYKTFSNGIHENARRQNKQEPAISTTPGNVRPVEPHDPDQSRLSICTKSLSLGDPADVEEHSSDNLHGNCLLSNRVQDPAGFPEQGERRLQRWSRLRIKDLTLMALFPILDFIRHGIVGQYIGCNGSSDTRSNSAPQRQDKRTQKSTGSKKRLRSSKASKPPGEDSDDEQSDNDEGPSKKHRRTESDSLQFACPYLKKDPVKYTGPRWKCHTRELSRIRDVKQHLYRRHEPAEYFCPRCSGIFRNREAFDDHTLSDFHCTPRIPRVEPDGITSTMRAQLNKRSPGTSEEQWYTMFAIVCPDQPRPLSPYNDVALLENVPEFWSFMETQSLQELSVIIMRNGTVPQQDVQALLSAFQTAQERLCREWMMSGNVGSSMPASALSPVQGIMTTSTDQQDQAAESDTSPESRRQAANGTLSSRDEDAFEVNTYDTVESVATTFGTPGISPQSIARAEGLSSFTGHEPASSGEGATYSFPQFANDDAVGDTWLRHGNSGTIDYNGNPHTDCAVEWW